MLRVAIPVIGFGVLVGLVMPSDPPGPPVPQGQVAAAVGRDPVDTRLERAPNGHFYVHATVNGQLVRFLVDTGATGVALTIEDARRVGEDFSIARFQVVGSGASGPVRGEMIRIDSIEIEGKRVENVGGAVLQGLDVSLLGQSYLSRMGSIEITGDEMVIRPAA